MTKIEPATDENMLEWEETITPFPFRERIWRLIARGRLEQRRAEAAERVVNVARDVWTDQDGSYGVVALENAVEAYDAAKANGFKEE